MMDYPQASLSIGVLEGDSHDGTMVSLERLLPRLQARGNRVTIVKRDFGLKLPEQKLARVA